MDANCLTVGAQISDRIPTGLAGRVLLKTSESLYWKTTQNDILLLHDARYGFIPFGLGIKDAGKLLAAADFPPGAEIVFSNGALKAGITELSLNLKLAQTQSNLVIRSPKQPAGIDLDVLRRYGAAHGNGGGMSELLGYVGQICGRQCCVMYQNFPGIFVRKAIPALTIFIEAIQRDDREGMQCGFSRISGLGPGLTPSGDDVLLGMTAAYMSARQAGIVVPPGAWYLPELILEQDGTDTSGVSGAYLCAAAKKGHFSLLDGVLSRMLDAGVTDSWEPRLKELTAIGSSSGTDILIGMVLAFETMADKSGHEGKGEDKVD